MKSYTMAVVTTPGKIEFQERSLPERGPHDVTLQIRAAAICGSDLHVFKGRHPSARLPSAIGHEISGQVVGVGKEVTRVKEGDRVTVEPVIACGTCEFCRRGQYHLCTRISFHYREGQGGFAQYFVANEAHVFRLPDGITYEEGALIEPLSVALHAVKNAGIRLGQSWAIFGIGAIGLLVLMLAKRASGGFVFVIDVNSYRLHKALEFGANRVINSHQEDALEVILDLTEQLGVDHSFEAVGIEATLVQSMKALKKGGAATLLGIYENPLAAIPANLIVQREITLRGSQGYNWDFQDSLTLLKEGVLALDPLITHRLPLEKLHEGFELLLNPESEAIKVVMQIVDSSPAG
jgi:2-desacetyl-2-hydroxyethyl bacteriochlorophyllide A dehydrogenase